MTMDFTEREIEIISQRLEAHPVTYHTLVRELGLSVTRSKKLLTKYYQSNKSTVGASFIATGECLGNFLVHSFNSESALEENLALTFDVVLSVHIYEIHLKRTTFTQVEIALEELRHPTDLNRVSEFHNLGLIKGPKLAKFHEHAKDETDRTVTKSSPIKPRLNKADEATSDTAKKPALVYRSSKPAAKSSLISQYVSRKGEDSNSTKKRASTEKKPAYQYKSRKLEQSEPKERVVVSAVVDEDDEDARKVSPMVSTSHSNLQNLFLDDEFTDDEDVTKSKEIQLEEDSQPIAVGIETPSAEESQKIDAPKIPEGSILRTVATISDETGSKLQQVQKPISQKTTIDEDGYFTLYKKADVEPKKPVSKTIPQLAKPPSSKPSTAKVDAKKKQTSLMSFFGKR